MTYYKYKFTESQEKDICQKYENKVAVKTICKEYLITFPVVYRVLKDNNIKLRGAITTDKNIINNVIKDLESGLSLMECHKKYKISISCLQKYLKQNNYKLKTNKGQFKQRYSLNNNYLENIDSHSKAQFLGIIYSDGTLSSCNKLISLRLEETDREYLEKIKKEIGSNKPISTLEGRKFISPLNKKEYFGRKTCVLDITNKKFYQDALKIGLVPRKTWANLGIPNIKDEYKKSFILGLFEGDGCITWNLKHDCFNLNFACSEKMANDILSIIKNELNIEGKIRKHQSIFILEYKRIKDIINIKKWMYKDTKFYMERKFTKFNNLFEIFKQKGYSVD